MNYLLVDKNEKLIALAEERGLNYEFGDIFEIAELLEERGEHPVICSASNPKYTFGGGLDAEIVRRYPLECKNMQQEVAARPNVGPFRIGDVIFCVTVKEDLSADPYGIDSALQYAKNAVEEDETLLFTGMGCGIGGLDPKKFVGIVERIFKEKVEKDPPEPGENGE